MIEIILQAERSLAVGQLDQAERLYRQAAELDPRNSIAVVGLARVALDRGNEREAYALARQALEIDPENAAGQRLAERLEEIMRFRGEEPPVVEAVAPASAAPKAPAGPESAPPAPPAPPIENAPPVSQKAPPPAAPRVPPPLPRKRPSFLDRIRRRR